ncbi:hypothetical protein L0222_25050 [bacterium]|nr:hypothetical protein [bacterium]
MKSNEKLVGFSLGAILPALGASISWFCCLPLIAGSIGAGFAATGSLLAPFRTYFSILSVLFLSFGFYQTYKPHRSDCGNDAHCAGRKKGLLQHLILWFAAAVTMGLLTIQKWGSWMIYWLL